MAAAFDPNHHAVVIYGGRTPADTWLDDTWSWDGTTWTQLQLSQHPTLRFAVGAFDPTISKLVVYGLTSDLKTAQTWTWDGSWQQVTGGPSPTRRVSSALAYDPSSHTVILFGGRALEDLAYLGDTWAFDGVSWKPVATNVSPSARQNPAMTTVPQGVLLFGGDARFTLTDTWTWNGSGWQALPTTHTPAINGMASWVAGMTSRNGQALILTYGSLDGPGQTYLFSQGDWTAA
jgi:hypothetical protein